MCCHIPTGLYFPWPEYFLTEWVFRSQNTFMSIAGFTRVLARHTQGLHEFHVSHLAPNIALVFRGRNKQNCLSNKLLSNLLATSFVIRQWHCVHVSRRHSSRTREYSSQPCSWVLDEGLFSLLLFFWNLLLVFVLLERLLCFLKRRVWLLINVCWFLSMCGSLLAHFNPKLKLRSRFIL